MISAYADDPPTDGTISVGRLATRAEVLDVAGDDIYVRSSLPTRDDLQAWRTGSGVAWFSRAPHRAHAGWLTVVAAPVAVVPLVHAAVADTGDGVSGVTVPAAGFDLLPNGIRPVEYNRWEWFWTAAPPPVQPLEQAVQWAEPGDEEAITVLLDGHSPRHSARPGAKELKRWAVVLDSGLDAAERQLVACGAEIAYVPGVPHLASIVTRTDARGRGLGGAVTAWLTRQILSEGAPLVTLGMYGDNDTARRVYHRLGYVDSHHWASGWLPGHARPERT